MNDSTSPLKDPHIGIAPQLIVNDLQKAKQFYTEFCNFDIIEETVDFLILHHNGGVLVLEQRLFVHDEKTENSNVRVLVNSVKSIHQKVYQSDIEIVDVLQKHPDGSQEFSFRDPFGFIIRIIQLPE